MSASATRVMAVVAMSPWPMPAIAREQHPKAKMTSAKGTGRRWSDGSVSRAKATPMSTAVTTFITSLHKGGRAPHMWLLAANVTTVVNPMHSATLVR